MKRGEAWLGVLCVLVALQQGVLADDDLPSPTNVTIYCYNLEPELRWDPVIVPDLSGPVTYTVQYRLSGDPIEQYSNVCENITETHCPFKSEIHIEWKVKLRVRAELGHLRSDWIETQSFQPTLNTLLGPVKALTVLPYRKPYSLFVTFQWPLSDKPLWKIKYDLYYWKKSSREKKNVTTIQTSELLEGLDPWTEYCVEVVVIASSIVGETSNAVCGMPNAPAVTTGGYIAIFSSVSFVFALCLACACLIYNKRLALKKWFQVPIRIPEHIQEFLEDQTPEEEPNFRPPVVACDNVSIVNIELLGNVNHSSEARDQAEEKT